MLEGIVAVLFVAFSLRYNWWRIPVSYRNARILMYHQIAPPIPGAHKRNKWRVSPQAFERQMAWFAKNGWHSFTVSELIEAETLPQRSFCITFDDGYADNYTEALPILKRYGFKATVYLVPYATENRWEAFEEESYDRLLNEEEIAEMVRSGLIEFGSHTLSHANLLRLPREEAYREIVASKRETERLTGIPCESFAYPYGKYDATIAGFVEKAGYRSAVTVKRGVYDKSEPFALRRIGILGTESFFDFYLKITRIRNKL